ncbi:MAG: ABC transporter ATP-binding protein [Anaerohalosphaeraceae bacterium]|nr:ABC transporter ATP-binding protein [Anaerohalosphaeraceae bacterium]
MASVSVSVKNISKKYRLFNNPKDHFLEAIHPFNKKYHREFWSLKDINLDIQKGTTVGIIGRNGSGKSTLLQIICSVLRPTSGTVETNGRISALLALGAGFNPEFSGRDNVLLNGALMGFSRAEMKKRMPTIESFAGIDDFIDQPMKIYSSGMSLRLAFAAAINVDPDIMIVDEALAVGDAKFQHKCFQKFLEFQRLGKTIIIVSHDINAVIKHCDKAVLLDGGQILAEGKPATIANYYTDLLFTGKLSGYSAQPQLLESDYRGFNIVHYKDKYYGVLMALGQIDFNSLTPEQVQEYVEAGRCVTATSFEQVKCLVDELKGRNGENANLSDSTRKEQTELKKFLEDINLVDNCAKRKSYNKNEYRQKYGKAEIIDYLIISAEGMCDPIMVCSGEVIDIYIKARFDKDVKFPLFGFSLKTVDGLLLYAMNNFFTKSWLQTAKESDVLVVRFSVKMIAAAGDVFVDMGVDEPWDKINNGESIGRQCAYDSLDRRCSIAHLMIQENNWFHGLADFEAVCQEVVRNGKETVKFSEVPVV